MSTLRQSSLSPVHNDISYVPVHQKPKKPATVTPKRFKKFFTPQSLHNGQAPIPRPALRHLTNASANRRGRGLLPDPKNQRDGQENSPGGSNHSRKRQRTSSHTISEGYQLSSTPPSEPFFLPSSQDHLESNLPSRAVSPEPADAEAESSEDESEVAGGVDACSPTRQEPVKYYEGRSLSSGLLSMRLSGSNGRRRMAATSNHDWRHETAAFHSRVVDTHDTIVHQRYTLPFCIAACNNNSLVAVGDEYGQVQLFDSSRDVTDGFTKPYLSIGIHNNAIMDAEFSADDAWLATGSGDQSARITDVKTQQILYSLDGHKSSVKRALFQPGSRNNIIATCGRDGVVKIWDLRSHDVVARLSEGNGIDFGDMHQPLLTNNINASRFNRPEGKRPAVGTGRVPRTGDTSVTSMLFMGAGREHLLATSLETEATVQLWDMRVGYAHKRARPLPVSITREPPSHESHRQFGITSIALNSDKSRLYAYCRDHTIYAYSTAHLILGNAPELSTYPAPPRRLRGADREGLGPLYGFRHDQLLSTTFFTKISVRKQKDDQSEVLAAGSSRECAVLFPTDERYLNSMNRDQSSQDPARPRLKRLGSSTRQNTSHPEADVPIHRYGTALIRGHHKEVTSTCWTNEGNLVTASDDFGVRCWREGDEARDLRRYGESDGKRWKCGWADVPGDFDDGDDDEE